jgi:hypothetical protein
LLSSARVPRRHCLDDLNLPFLDAPVYKQVEITHLPALILVNPEGKTVWRHDGYTLAGQLGLMLSSLIGNPDYAQMSPE